MTSTQASASTTGNGDAPDRHEAIAADRRRRPVTLPETLHERLHQPGAAAAVRAGGDRDGAALLVAATDAFHERHPGAFTFFHEAGAGGDATETGCLYRRLLGAIRAHCALYEPLPDTTAELESYLANWLARAAAGTGALVTVASCNRLDSRARDALMRHRPPGLRMLLSADDRALPEQWPAWPAPEPDEGRDRQAADDSLDRLERAIDDRIACAGKRLLALLTTAREPADLAVLADELNLTTATLSEALAVSPHAIAITNGYVYPLAATVTDALTERAGSEALAEAHRRWAELRPRDAVWHLMQAGDDPGAEALMDDPDTLVTLATAGRRQDLLDHWAPERIRRAALASIDRPAEDRVRVQRIEAAADMLDRLRASERLDDLLRTATRLRERLDGPEASTTANALDRWGAFRLDRGDHDEAGPLLERAYTIRAARLGAEHPDTLATAHRQTQLLEARGDMDAAENRYRQALERAEARYGGGDPAVIPHIVNLAALRRARGALDTAKPLYQRALKVAEERLGSDHPTAAAAHDNLAGCLYGGHDFDSAVDAYRRALTIAERIFGPEHEATAAALHNLATTLDAQQRFRDAEPHYRRALEIRHDVLGEDHEDTLSTMHNLAAVLESTGRTEEAESMYRRAVSGWERLVGADHPATATSLNNLADLLRDRGALAEAEDLYRRNLETWRRLLGEEHPNTLTTIAELGALYADAGRPDAARPLLEQAVECTGRVMGPQTLAHINAVCELARLLRDTGERTAARDLLERTLAAAEGTLGIISPRVQKVRRQLEALDA